MLKRDTSTLKQLTYVKCEMFAIVDSPDPSQGKYSLVASHDGTLVASADRVHELSRYAFDECGAQAVAHRYKFTVE